MSHFIERKEKNCLNCNAIVYGRFCHICGQENAEPKDSFGHLATHFISDIFHFDGKFFSTAKYLLFRPGFLTYEYVRGRRASYLNPIKMYVFISAIFFIFFLAIYKPGDFIVAAASKQVSAAAVLARLNAEKQSLQTSVANKTTPAFILASLQQRLRETEADVALLQKDSTKKYALEEELNNNIEIDLDKRYINVSRYDSEQNKLPAGERDNWVKTLVIKRSIAVNQKYKGDKNSFLKDAFEAFFHHFPQALFVSLPLFALLLQLLFVRHKKWFYVNHIIYTVHLYCAIYIFLFCILVLSKISAIDHFNWLSYAVKLLWFYTGYYTYKALKNFYSQGWIKTFFKWWLLNFTAIIIMIFLLSIYFILTALTL